MSDAAREFFGEKYESISKYVDILAGRGIEWGLIGPREADRLWERHILNSVAPNELIAAGSTVADIGSGAGLPGIPLALLRPDLQITLIEPLLRRYTFLTQAVDELGITDRVTVVRARAEQHRGRYDVVLSRAVAPLERLVVWCAPLRAPDGMILAMKGSSAADEVRSAAPRLRAAGLRAALLTARASAASEPTTVVRITAA